MPPYRPSPLQAYSRREYWRDSRDRITAWKKNETGRGDRYSYDDEGELTVASYQALTPETTPTSPLRTDSFAYDELGNRMRSNYVAGRGWMDFLRRDNGLNQYLSWTPSPIYYDDNYPSSSYTYPGNGNMMADGWITASYNALNQPVAIWSPTYNGTSNYMWFGFDPLGRCVKRTVGPALGTGVTVYFSYEGWNLIQEDVGGASANRIYVHGNRVDEIVADYYFASPQWRFHHYDARGHCILLTDGSGALIEQYEYDAFGKPYFYNASGLSLTGSGNRFLFTGREWLSDVKLYDFRNRLYQPELGRFLQPDPKQFAAGDYNLYRYCHNDPVNKTDPMGLWGGPFPYGEDIIRFFDSLWNAGPKATWDAQSIVGDTTGTFAVSQGQLATKQFGNNPNAGEAVRHEVWQAELTRKFREAASKAVGDAHEKRETDQKDSARDQYNNKLGREQGLASKSRSDSVERAKRDWQNGWSARDKSDPRLNEELKKLEQDRKK